MIYYAKQKGVNMQVQKIQSLNLQQKNNTQSNKKQNINFTASGNSHTVTKKGCGFLMALSIATVAATIAAPIVTYNYLSKNEKENGKTVNILSSVGTGLAAFGLGTASLFRQTKNKTEADIK